MVGTLLGGKRAAETNKKRYGADFYRINGQKGGRAGHTGGFASNPELARIAGRKGGLKSRRGPVGSKKPNIKRPFLGDNAFVVMRSSTKMAELYGTKPIRFWNIKARAQKNALFGTLYEFLDSKDWVGFFTLINNMPRLCNLFRETVLLLEGSSIDKFDNAWKTTHSEGLSDEMREGLTLSMFAIPSVKKGYEYVTGRSFKSNKKIHRGLIDQTKEKA